MALLAGAIGALVGLLIGLISCLRTAWFAVFKLGIPAALVRGVLGLVAGRFVTVVNKVHGRGTN